MTMTLSGSGTTTVGVPNQATAQNTTGGTAITFSGLPSGIKRITLTVNGVSTNGTNYTCIQLGAGSVTASGYNGTVCSNGGSAAAFSSSFQCGIGGGASGASVVRYGQYIFTNSSGNSWTMFGIESQSTNITYSAGAVTLAGTLDRIIYTTVGGTDAFDLGSVNIVYE